MSDDYDSDPYHGEPQYYSQSSRRRSSRQQPYEQDYIPQTHSNEYYSSTPRNTQYNEPYTAHQQPPSTWSSSGQFQDYNYTHASGLSGYLYSQPQTYPDQSSYQRYYGPAQEDVASYRPQASRLHSNTYPIPSSHSAQPTVPQSSYSEESAHPEHGRPHFLTSHEILDPRYVVQDRSFYTVGKVFSVLWHENDGRGNGTVATSRGPLFIGRFRQPIYSNIRRMVVIKNYPQCSWCIAINTYGGQGVAKQGIDESQHAIVHMRGTSAMPSRDERRMIKEPLEISPDREGERLDRMSRLNFGKIYTVEHNVKVLPIGHIAARSMARFRQYAAGELTMG